MHSAVCARPCETINESQHCLLLSSPQYSLSLLQVTHGATTLRKIENLGSRSGTVDGEVKIVKCGVLPNLADSAAANAPDSELLDETGRRADRIMK